MSKSYYDSICERRFGPYGQLVRSSSNDRGSRFLVCGRPERMDGGGYRTPVYGSGPSWRAALMVAFTSESGRAAAMEQKVAVKWMQTAMNSETPHAFADSIMEQTISELKASGANEEEIQAVREKFTKAKEHIK